MMKIDKARAEDIGEMMELMRQLSSSETDREKALNTLRRMAANPDCHLLVARDESGRVRGTAMGILCHELIGDCVPFMLAENVVVDEAYRGQGIGRQLMEGIERIALQNRCSVVTLLSEGHRQGAHAAYEKLGYKKTDAVNFKKILRYD